MPIPTSDRHPPRRVSRPILSLRTAAFRSAVTKGVVQTMNETLLAMVYWRAVFSDQKYRLPPITPANTSNSSSFKELQKSLAGD